MIVILLIYRVVLFGFGILDVSAVFIDTNVLFFVVLNYDFHNVSANRAENRRGKFPTHKVTFGVVRTTVKNFTVFRMLLHYIAVTTGTFRNGFYYVFNILALRIIRASKEFAELSVAHDHMRAAFVAYYVRNFFFHFYFFLAEIRFGDTFVKMGIERRKHVLPLVAVYDVVEFVFHRRGKL